MQKKKILNYNYVIVHMQACEDTKAIIIGTEWNEFRALDFLKITGSSKKLVIFDLRNIYNAKEIEDLGFKYFGTGK